MMQSDQKDDKLKVAAEDVAHDVQQLGDAFHFVETCGLRIAYVAWCRNLMAFFGGHLHQKHPSDLLAVHYFDDHQVWESKFDNAQQGSPTKYDSYWEASCALSSHLSINRRKFGGTQERPPSSEVTDYLNHLYDLFLQNLDPDRRKWFEEAEQRLSSAS